MIGMLALELVKNNIPFMVDYMGEMPVIRIKSKNDKISYLRISYHEGDYGYYVRNTGLIEENRTIDDIMKEAKKLM